MRFSSGRQLGRIWMPAGGSWEGVCRRRGLRDQAVSGMMIETWFTGNHGKRVNEDSMEVHA